VSLSLADIVASSRKEIKMIPKFESKYGYISKTHKKYLPIAYNWCKENNRRYCQIKRTGFFFDFENNKCEILIRIKIQGLPGRNETVDNYISWSWE
jgi:hypothetical protein